jgi:hypothetical protein
VVWIVIPLCYWIHFSILFLTGFNSTSSSSLNSACIVVKSSLTPIYFCLFSFSFFIELRVGHAKSHTHPLISFCSFDSVILLLIVIVLFTLIIFNLILFSISSLMVWFCYFFLLNSVIVLVITICLVLNHFLDWFFFNYIPKNLFSFNFYVKFGHNSFNCYFFIIIFLIGLFFSIPSQNILFYFIFISNLVLNLLNCYLFCFALFFYWLFLSQFHHSIFLWLRILLLIVYGFVFNAVTLVLWSGLEIRKTSPIWVWSFLKHFF